MSEEYWVDYFEKQKLDANKNVISYSVNEIFEENKKKIHHLQHYSMCKTDNPFIRQIRSSPNITTKGVAELICRSVACDLQYCLSMQKQALENPRRNIDIGQCKSQIKNLNVCLIRETTRIQQKELELRELVETGKLPESIVAKAQFMAKQTEDAYNRVETEITQQQKPVETYI